MKGIFVCLLMRLRRMPTIMVRKRVKGPIMSK